MAAALGDGSVRVLDPRAAKPATVLQVRVSAPSKQHGALSVNRDWDGVLQWPAGGSGGSAATGCAFSARATSGAGLLAATTLGGAAVVWDCRTWRAGAGPQNMDYLPT